MATPIAALSIVATVLSLTSVAAQAQGKPSGLPEGLGKDRVERFCLACHQAREILNSSGYTREGWKELASTMINLSAAPEDQDAITQYLATHFPPNTRRAPKLVSGAERIAFKEWLTPTPGSRSRDPIQAADGTIWYAGQWSNLIGRINPKTGEIKEYALPANAKPHTVTLDAKGNVWYAGNGNATIGSFDPKTEKITEFKMPDPQAKDPHSMVFDAKGILWFTMQLSNRVGRLDPATMELTEVKVPGEKATVRRLDFDRDGTIWYVNSGEGRLGRYSPKTGEIKEWPSPSGPRSHPYAIVVLNGIVWYNESYQRPDTLVRFDPKTETFQSWAIPSGGVHAGIIRHMRATRDGNLIIHQSSTNRIILVTPVRGVASR